MTLLNTLMCTTALIISFATSGRSIIAYDCGAPSMNISTLSLVDIQECTLPISDPLKASAKIQLLQVAEYTHVQVRQCKVEIRRSIFHCGMHSHISAVSNGEAQYIEEVEWHICEKLHKEKSLRLFDKYFTGFKLNATTNRAATLAGKIDAEGNCKGTHFSDHYGSWDNVVVNGQIIVTLADYLAPVKLQENEIILRSGIRCNYMNENCMDIEGGNSYWDYIYTDNCRFTEYTVLYEGLASRITPHPSEKFEQIMFSVSTEDYTFALGTRGKKGICGYSLYQTEHPRLFILDEAISLPFAHKKALSPLNIEIFTYVNSKFVYLEKHFKQQIISLYNNVLQQECKTESKLIKMSLAMAPIAPAEFAYFLMKGPGYLAHIAGEVIRVAKCIPVEVQSRKTDRCFQELAVTRGNDSLFMLPRTHVITKTGNEIECNTFLAPMYNINEAWWQATPKLAIGVTPDRIGVDTQSTWSYINPNHLATGGIYSPTDLERLKGNLMFPVEKSAVLNTIAREATGQVSLSQGISVNSLLDEEKIKETFSKFWNKITNTFTSIGLFSAGILGFYTIARLAKFALDTIIHCYSLHAAYGWSIYLFGAIWDSVTHLLIHLKNKTEENSEKDVEIGTNKINRSGSVETQTTQTTMTENVRPNAPLAQTILVDNLHPSFTFPTNESTPLMYPRIITPTQNRELPLQNQHVEK